MIPTADQLSRVRFRDVTLRDGLQGEQPVDTACKRELALLLLQAGIHELEIGSFVRPDRVPAMADTADLLRELADVREPLWVLVLNASGAERALDAGACNLSFVFSASDTHNRSNAGRTTEDSLRELERIVHTASGHEARLEVTIATAFGCPYDGEVPRASVIELMRRVADVGPFESIVLADTIGTAAPNEVYELARCARAFPQFTQVGVHLHDTRGMGLANALAAILAGTVRVDAALGGLGGCPFAPGATGNLATEDLVHCIGAMDPGTALDVPKLVDAAEYACSLVGRSPTSHVAIAGGRFARLAQPEL